MLPTKSYIILYICLLKASRSKPDGFLQADATARCLEFRDA
jgi:hypothetical protein